MTAIEHRVKRLEDATDRPTKKIELEEIPLTVLKLLAVRMVQMSPEARPGLEAEFRRRALSEEEIAQVWGER
jgi:hypothetical protein